MHLINWAKLFFGGLAVLQGLSNGIFEKMFEYFRTFCSTSSKRKNLIENTASSREAINSNFIVFGLTHLGTELQLIVPAANALSIKSLVGTNIYQ